jgi:predicted nucleic acid-binding Zn ribbon protein
MNKKYRCAECGGQLDLVTDSRIAAIKPCIACMNSRNNSGDMSNMENSTILKRHYLKVSDRIRNEAEKNRALWNFICIILCYDCAKDVVEIFDKCMQLKATDVGIAEYSSTVVIRHYSSVPVKRCECCSGRFWDN